MNLGLFHDNVVLTITDVRDVNAGIVMNLGLFHDNVVLTITDVRDVTLAEIPGLNPMSQGNAAGGVVHEMVLTERWPPIRHWCSPSVLPLPHSSPFSSKPALQEPRRTSHPRSPSRSW